MKHLKTFENNKFEVGDLVVCCKNDKYKMHGEDVCNFLKNNVAKIYKIGKSSNNIILKYSKPIPGENKYHNWFLNSDEIRFATPSEIEKYEIEKNTNKYNL